MSLRRHQSFVGMDRAFWPLLGVLGLVLLGFELTDLDLVVQDPLYDAQAGRWRVDAADPLLRAIFYTGPKVLLILLGLASIALAAGPVRCRAALGFSSPDSRRHLIVLVATLATGPALVGWGKSATNVFCPSEIRRYGGDVPYVTLCGSYPADDRPARAGHCFPAGHASGGSALVALAGIARTGRGRRLGLAAGVAAGGIMGAYQMLKGAHYLSHTVFTLAAIAWIFLLWRRLLGVASRGPADSVDPGLQRGA
jgi:membrane-associated PAP2 superfamily phosphatase